MSTSSDLAKKILEVIPPSMARIREDLRSSYGNVSDLSVPQLRVMGCVKRGLVLVGDIAKHQGVSQPAMSKMVEGLVERGLIERYQAKGDRRQVPLRLTKSGTAIHTKIWKSAELKILETRLPDLSIAEQKTLLQALDSLQKIFLEKDKRYL
jgi:DNA-binding MarR family transcriptional regulator